MPIPVVADSTSFLLDCRGRVLDCRPGMAGGAHVMGILNVTPDSFSDAGRYATKDAALKRAETMVGEGAAIIDVGGESTRPRGRTYGPGADVVDADEERRRVLPVIEAIGTHFPDVLISIDTYKPEVARDALDAGAHIVNDVTGLRIHPETAEVAARAGAPLVVMHAQGVPGDMPHALVYGDVVVEVRDALAWSVATAERAGVRHIVTDPGFGFGKTPEENLRLVANVGKLLELGRPVLVGISRKSTIGMVLDSAENPRPVSGRLFGSLGSTAVSVLQGATIVRTHDVGPTVDLLRVLAFTASMVDESL